MGSPRVWPLGCVAAAMLLLAAPATAPAALDPTLAAVGDIACPGTQTPTSDTCQQAATAALVSSAAPNAVAVLGDNQYDSGTYAEYTDPGGFDSSWGGFMSMLHPAPGNHEYLTANAAGYFDYFDGASQPTGMAGDRGKGWYSYDLGVWHLVALNSSDDCATVSCALDSDQEKWLKADLAAHPGQCTVAYWHHPRFSSGNHGDDAKLGAFWGDLYAARADLVLNGHDHDYERFAPQTPAAAASSAGMREFVVGTGGELLFTFGSTFDANSEHHQEGSYGVLFLTLHPGSYDWAFKKAGTGETLDSGTSSCHWQPPTAATDAVGSVSATTADLAGTVDAHGDATTYRFEWGTTSACGNVTPDGSAGSGAGPQPATVTLAGLQSSTTYHYRVVARSPAGSAQGADRTFTTPAPPQAPPDTAQTPPPSQPSPQQGLPAAPSSLTAAFSLSRVQRLVSVLRRGVRLTLSCSRACTVRVTLILTRPGGGRGGDLSAGRARMALPPERSRALRLRLGSRARRALAGLRGARVAVRIEAAAGADRARATRTVLLR